MKWFTIGLLIAIVGLVTWMFATRNLAPADFANNLTAELLGAVLTVVVVKGIADREQRRRHAGILSELLFMPLLDVRSLIKSAARFLTADLPPGVEADEQWGRVADEMHTKREKLAPIIPDNWLISVVELEDAVRRLDFTTARGEETRSEYARDVISVWRRYHRLMSFIIPPNDRRDKHFNELLTEPPDLTRMRTQYKLDGPPS